MSKNYLVDSHCHLDFPEYAGQLDDVVARAGKEIINTQDLVSARE